MYIYSVTYMSHEGGAYVQWGWSIRPMGVAFTSNGGGVYVQWGWRIHPKVQKWRISPEGRSTIFEYF